MKRIIILLLTITVFLCGCGINFLDDYNVDSTNNYNTDDKNKELKIEIMGDFSYKEKLAYYTDNNFPMRNDGFKNTTITVVKDAYHAVELAKKEVNKIDEFEEVNVYYDSEAEIYSVVFLPDGAVVGGDITFFINKNGMTLYSILGE